MNTITDSPLVARAIDHAKAQGWIVELREYCEDSETPGFLGQYVGVCCHDRKAIKVRTTGMGVDQIVAVIEHELEHASGKKKASDRPDLGFFCGGSS